MSYFLAETELIGNWEEWYLIFFSQSLSNKCFFWQGDGFIWECLLLVTLLLCLAFNREEKSLHHIAMVAKFLDDNKPKRHLHCKKWILSASNFIDLISFNLICQMLAKFSGLNRKWPYVSLEKEKEKSCVVLTYSIRWASEIRKFHVAVVQQWLRNILKSVMHVQRCFFANLNLLLFFCSPLLLQKLPIVAIQKFCYHGNMMSHFSFLLQVALIEYSEFIGYVTHGIWSQHNFHCKKILTLFLSSGFRCYYFCYCLKSMIILN